MRYPSMIFLKTLGNWASSIVAETILPQFAYSWSLVVAGVFVLIALLLSAFLIFEHLSWYNNPEEQKFLIGVVLIVPLYATESFLSLNTSQFALEWEILRDCYEAFALYAFSRYLIACLGGEDKTIDRMEKAAIAGPRTPLLEHRLGKMAVKHIFPMNYLLKPWSLGQEFYQNVKFGIVQYMILKTLCALLALLLQWIDAYGEGQFQWNKGYAYIAIVINFSQCWALYCIVQFYHVTRDDLAPINPLVKFLCLKSIIFLTWWQGLLIAFVFSMGPLKNLDSVQSSLQDFLICIEMGFAAISHIYAFPAKPYQNMGYQEHRKFSVLSDYASGDLIGDLEDVKDMERKSIERFRFEDTQDAGTSLGESMHDVVFKGGEYLLGDLIFTVEKAKAPVEKGISRLNETFHNLKENVKHHHQNKKKKRKTSKDDSCLSSSPSSYGSVKGIDDLLLGGVFSDSCLSRANKQKHLSPSCNNESSGESSDQGMGCYRVSGNRWTIKGFETHLQ